MPGAAYGKEKEKCWYFHNISDATINIMANVGRPLDDYEQIPAHFVKQKEVKVEPEFVKAVVEQKLDELKEHKNGSDSSIKHRKASSNVR